MRDILKLWLAPLLAFAIAYGVFWSYSVISAQRQIIMVLTEQRDALLSGLQERCEVQLDRMGYQVVPKPVEEPQEPKEQ